MAGNPNIRVSYPSGIGAGVVCNFASFDANDGAEDLAADREVRLRKSVTRKEVDGCAEN